MNNQYIDFLAKELIREKLVIFVGAGVSIDSKLPSWNGLVRKFAKELGMDKEWFTTEETLAIPEIYYKKFGKVPYYEILDEIFCKEYEPNLIHEALEKLGVNYLITTNYDTLIEDKINEGYDYDIVKKDEDLAHTSKGKMIIKMHGDLENKNVILRKSEFEEYENLFPLVSTFIKGLFTANTILFIGYSLNDPNVKNIMSWIKNILKEDFRKVYLIEYDNDSINIECEEDPILNRIILPDLSRKEYSEKTKKELLEKKGELLKDFLEDINKRKIEKIKDESIFIYSNLNYLMNIQFKELLEGYSISRFSTLDKGLLGNKELESYNKDNTIDDVTQYKEILIKSDIEKINNILMSEVFKNDQKLKKLLEDQKKYDELIELILVYDKDGFESFLKENEGNIEGYIHISGYIFFESYNLAREKAEKMLKQYQKENNKEKIMWVYYILDIIENLEKNKNFDFTEKVIDIKKIYNKYFKRRTELYNEIIKSKTLERVHKEMDKYLSKAKNSRRTSFGGFTPLNKAQFLIRDIYKFHILNGVSLNFSELKIIIKKYVEILCIAYKNDMGEKDKFLWNIMNLKKFEYSDYYFMLQIDYKDLENLFSEHNIESLKSDEDVIDKLIKTLKNILNILDQQEKQNKNNSLQLLEKIFLLLYKSKLTEKQFNEILEVFIMADRLYILYLDDIFYRTIQNFFRGILYKNKEYLKKDKLNIFILNIISNKEKPNEITVGILTYYHSIIVLEKLKNTNELQNYFNRNNLIIKLYFLRLLDESIKKVEVEKIIEIVKENFNLKIYKELLTLGYAEKNEEIESKIIPNLDNIFQKKYSKYSEYDNILYSLYSLLENNNISEKIKNDLKHYNNEIFKYYLKESNQENEWKYFLEQEKFDYGCFTIEDLKLFTEFGIKKIIKKGNKNKKFIKMLQEHLTLQSDNKIMKGYLEFSFENIESNIAQKQPKRVKIPKKILDIKQN